MRYARVVTLLVVAAVSRSSVKIEAQFGPAPILTLPQTRTTAETHVAWVFENMKRMEAIKAGMTRKQLLAVFTTEGGVFTSARQTFVNRDCPYFKVDVVFQAVGRPDRDQDARVTREDERDTIASISRPYLAGAILD
jgi:hypothetical protein